MSHPRVRVVTGVLSKAPAPEAAQVVQPSARAEVPDWDTTKDSEGALQDIRVLYEAIADTVLQEDRRDAFSGLVAPAENDGLPVHRWYYYKEAFAAALPLRVLDTLGAGATRTVADVFGGVGTTALALQGHPALERVVSVEYAPFPRFVGSTKLCWADFDPSRLRRHINALLEYKSARRRRPDLAAFRNPEIFDESVLNSLLSARQAIWDRPRLRPEETAFLELGLASILEGVSGAMKDGRALRILRDRDRPRRALSPRNPVQASTGSIVKDRLRQQWFAMLEDVEALQGSRRVSHGAVSHNVAGDARRLDLVIADGVPMFGDASVGLGVFSPPYLNCIDYSEVYKLETWMLEFVEDQGQFRKLREGTLRSHPSIKFPPTDHLKAINGAAVAKAIAMIADFIEAHHKDSAIGRMVRNYFEDMYVVIREQFRVLEPGGHMVCVVGNSTFTGRERKVTQIEVGKSVTAYEEQWRLPVLTDLLLAGLAREAGFGDVALWTARTLRPRNATGAAARESLVVARK
jgi:hypothetical protein